MSRDICVRDVARHNTRIDRGQRAGITTTERSEVAELRRENARLRMERNLLKRATAF